MSEQVGTWNVGLDHQANWWADLPADIAEPSGPQRNPLGWLALMTAFLLPLVIPATHHLLSAGKPLWWVIFGFALILVYCLCYLLFPLFLRRSRRTNFSFCISMVLVGLALFFFYGNSPYVIIYATGILVFALPAAWSLIISGATLLIIAVVLVSTGKLSDSYGDVITVVSVTFTLFMMSRLVFAVRALRQANRRIGALAVAAERERMARDLHDILGHSLTTITVKAGLARRVLESSGDVERAIVEIRDVEALTRSVLSDVRTTVSENREVSLSTELVGARAALQAAGIDAELPSAVDNLRPDLQRTFGYVLREAVTNVLRHSGAGRVEVRLGDTWMEIEDDGDGTAAAPGNGLRGLAERLALVGGTIHAAGRSGGGFLVRAELA
ncbi:MAG: two-component system, NarL family, sensor histidine kinase DesK [Actinomycetota bacterium]|jgi:two-component system sensor histidine kinase DesK|nr:two-component system, NarL family, sensor histidine kinase DesK [Actinomycetota bacterium]